MKVVRTAVTFVLLSIVATSAQAGPQAIQPKPEGERAGVHYFYDRTAKIELSIAVAADAFDTAQTCHGLANGAHELGLPTQHCAPATLLLAAQVAGQELVAYSFHRLGWHRPEKFVRLFSILQNVRGIVRSKQLGGW